MMRDHERVSRIVSAAVRRDEAASHGGRSGWTTWRPIRRRGVLAAVMGLAVASLAGCEVDTGMERARAGGASSESGDNHARAVRPASDGSGAAVLVANRRPVPVPADPSPAATVSYEDAEGVFRAGDYAAAADLFQAYALRKAENPWGHYMLGLSAWRAGDAARAEAALRRTVELDPRHGKGLLNLARVLLDQRKASDALEYVEQVIELEPESGEAWRVLGNVRSELGMVEDAVEAYREALVLDPQDAWSMNNLGLLMIREGRYEGALPPLARATELRPDAAVFQNNLGIALERNGHVTEAAAAFRAALTADAEYEKARVSLERVESQIPSAAPVPLDLTGLAGAFADEVNRWSVQTPGADAVEPVDTVGLEPEVTVGAEPKPAAGLEPKVPVAPANPAGEHRMDTTGTEPMDTAVVEPKDTIGEAGQGG